MDKWSLTRLRIFAILLAAILLIHLGSGFVIYLAFDSWPDRGQFGDMFGAANALFSGLALAAVLYAVFMVRVMKEQLDDSRQWNRMTFTFTQLRMAEVLSPLEEGLNKTWVRLMDRDTPLTSADIDKLFSDAETETRSMMRRFLNELERFAAAVNLGLGDDDLAKRLYRHKLTRHFLELKPYIEQLRARQNAPSVLKELEDLVVRWQSPPSAAKSYASMPAARS